MNINIGNFPSIERMHDELKAKTREDLSKDYDGVSFGQIFSQKADAGLKFSKHAANRLSERNIDLTDSQLDRLELGAKKAQDKGINESLVIVDQLAFIVSVPNSTVITAMDQSESDDNIYTNIDGAVIM